MWVLGSEAKRSASLLHLQSIVLYLINDFTGINNKMDDDYMYDVDLDAAYEKTVGPSEMPMTMYKGNEKSIGSYVK